jgi:hypothetical protein
VGILRVTNGRIPRPGHPILLGPLIEFLLHLLLPLQQRLIPLQKLTAIHLTIKLPFCDGLLQTVMVDEMAAGQSAQEDHAGTAADHAFHAVGLHVQFFVWVEVLADVFRDIGVCGSEEVQQLGRLQVYFLDFGD